MTKGDTVEIKAIGMRGRIGDTSGRQFRVDLPDGRWGWHYPEELQPCEFDFAEAQKRFGKAVARENELTCEAFLQREPIEHDVDDMSDDVDEDDEEEDNE